MKTLRSFMALLGLLLTTNCSEIPPNNDPILGVWVRTDWEENGQNAKRTRISKEWIFNDVYLGRYQEYRDYKLVYYTDFSWEAENDGYELIYHGTDRPAIELLLNITGEVDQLLYPEGEMFAERESPAEK